MLEVIIVSLIVTAIIALPAFYYSVEAEKEETGYFVILVVFVFSMSYFSHEHRELNKEIETAKAEIKSSPYQGETSYYSFGLSKDNQLTAVSKEHKYVKPLYINCDLEDHSLCQEAEAVKFVIDFSNGLKKAMKENGMKKDIKVYSRKP